MKRKISLLKSKAAQNTVAARYDQDQLLLNLAKILKSHHYDDQVAVISNKSGTFIINSEQIKKVGIQEIVRFLSHDLSIKSYSFDLRGMTKKDLAEIGEGFKANKSITDLALNLTSIRSSYLETIAESVAKNLGIQKLKVSCNIQSSVIQSIIIMIKGNSITDLDLSSCNINNNNLNTLCSALKPNKSLVHFNISNNHITDLNPLNSLLISNKALIEVGLESNRSLKSSNLQKLEYHLTYNRSLIEKLCEFLLKKFGEDKVDSQSINREVRGDLKLFQVVDLDLMKETLKVTCDNNELKSKSIMFRAHEFICENYFELLNVCKDLTKPLHAEVGVFNLPKTFIYNILEVFGRKSLWQVREETQSDGLINWMESELMHNDPVSISDMNIDDINFVLLGEINASFLNS